MGFTCRGERTIGTETAEADPRRTSMPADADDRIASETDIEKGRD
jgi:hypothetical protein